MEDRFSRFLMSVIAFALTLIALNPWIAPRPAQAQVGPISNVRLVYVSPDVMQDIQKAGGVLIRQ